MSEKTINIQSHDLLDKLYPNQLILFEAQKKAVCKFYACSDSHDRQYPDCDYKPSPCRLAELQEVLWFINQKENCQEKEAS